MPIPISQVRKLKTPAQDRTMPPRDIPLKEFYGGKKYVDQNERITQESQGFDPKNYREYWEGNDE